MAAARLPLQRANRLLKVQRRADECLASTVKVTVGTYALEATGRRGQSSGVSRRGNVPRALSPGSASSGRPGGLDENRGILYDAVSSRLVPS